MQCRPTCIQCFTSLEQHRAFMIKVTINHTKTITAYADTLSGAVVTAMVYQFVGLPVSVTSANGSS